MRARESRRRVLTALASSLALLASLAAPAASQTALTASIGRAFQSFPAADQSGQATDASFEVERTFANRVRLFYDGDVGTFSAPGDWGYALHVAGIVVQKGDTTANATRLTAGASGSWRSNGASWDAAGYVGLRGFLDVEWRPSATTTVHTGYQFDRRAFDELPDLDQREHTVVASLLSNLQVTRTTLFGQAAAGAKAYAGDSGSGAHLARQLTLIGRVAQNLTARTGVSLQYSRRLISGRVPPVLVLTPPLFFDDGVYDDLYASAAQSWRAGVTRVLGAAGSLDAALSEARKNYRDFPALDLDGMPIAGGGIRADTIRRAGLTWTLPISRDHTGPLGVDVNVGYGYTRHRSNDLVYNYSSHSLGIGLTVAH